MVAHHRDDLALLQRRHHLFGLRAIADIVAKRENLVNLLLLNIVQHRLQGLPIAMDISDDRQPRDQPVNPG